MRWKRLGVIGDDGEDAGDWGEQIERGGKEPGGREEGEIGIG